MGGSRYFVTFIDDFSRCISVYFIKHKTEVFEKFKLFEAMVTNECDKPIMKLRTDNGGEYTSTKFHTYLAS
jgi:5'-3' exoribonuclease 2